jgi:putative membrane protein
MDNSSKLPFVLLGAYVVFCFLLSFNPYDRATWFVENLTVWIIVSIIVILYLLKIRFSNTSYIFVSILIFLHTIGGHYTFALVPFDWVTNFFDFSRNHFDRLAHFSVGFYAFPIAEWLYKKKLVANKFLLFTYPIFVIATVAMTYELIEWIYAASASSEAGAAYLGSQGDIWDAQKDMLADTLGALFAILVFYFLRVRSKVSFSESRLED